MGAWRERWGVAVPAGASAGSAIVGPAYDRLWFGAGAAAVSVAFVAAGRALGPGATLALYVAFNALFNLPHQLCTWLRAFGEPGEVPRTRWATLMALVLVFMLAVRAVPAGEALVLTNLMPYWGLWHLASQHFGITRIYRRKVAGDTRFAAWDRAFFVALFALGLLRVHAATDLTFRVRGSVTAMWRLPIPAEAGHTLTLLLGVVFAALAVARVAAAYRDNRSRAAFEGTVAFSTFVGFFCTDEIMMTTAAITALHDLHYIGLVRFYRATRARTEPAAALGLRHLVAAYGYSVGVHAIFLVSAFAGEALMATLVASHYLVDTVIWRIRRTPALAVHLGLPGRAPGQI